LAEPMEHEPRRLLRHADLLRELEGRDALPRRDEEIHRVEPLVQRDVAALEDGPRADGEVLPAFVAAVEPALARGDALTLRADRAAGSIRPEPRLEVEPGRLGVGEHLEELEGGDGHAVRHVCSTMRWLREETLVRTPPSPEDACRAADPIS